MTRRPVRDESCRKAFLKGQRSSPMISRSCRLLHVALLATCGAGMIYAPAADAQTSITLQLGQPSYYGPISIGYGAQPPIYSTRPVIVAPPRGRERWAQTYNRPVYLRVPRNQARDWSRYCGRYQACNRPVYFVRDEWYRNVYAPRVRAAAVRNRRDRWRSSNQPVMPVVVTPPGRGWGPDGRRGRERD